MGVALVDGHLVFSHPAVHILSLVVGVLTLVLSFSLCDELRRTSPCLQVSTFLWLACLGPRTLHSLGIVVLSTPLGLLYLWLKFGSISLRSNLLHLGFDSFAYPSLGYRFLVRVPVWLGELCWLTIPSPGVSLSL